MTDWLLWLAGSMDLGMGIALATAVLGALGYHAARRQAHAAERANELTKQELAATTAQTHANQSELLSVLATVQELYARLEAQQAAIEECHRARDAEQKQRKKLEDQLQSERISARARLHTVSEEMQRFRQEYRYLSELYVALSQGWTHSLARQSAAGQEQS